MFLTELLYVLIWCFGIFFFVKIILKPELIYEYPFLMSFGFAIFILPQVYVVYEKDIFYNELTNRLFLMTLLCWIMSFVGWYTYHPKKLIFQKNFLKPFNENKVALVAAVFIVIGMIMNFLAARIFQTTEFENQQATGVATIFVFFQHLLFIGTGLSLALYLKSRQRIVLFITVVGILYCFYIGVLQGRRQQTLNALFVIGVPLFLKYKLKPPRILVVAALVSAFLLVPSMDQYRKILKTSESAGVFFQRMITEIEYTKNMREFYIKSSKSIELVNAGYEISDAYRYSEYKLGLGYWNMLVFQFIPAQLTSKEFKESLMFDGSFFGNALKYAQKGNPNYMAGSTVTGIGDAFVQFDYFGCLFFLFLGMFMKRIWLTCNETQNVFVQTFYSILLIECLLGLTHGTAFFFPGLIKAFCFLYITNLFARQ